MVGDTSRGVSDKVTGQKQANVLIGLTLKYLPTLSESLLNSFSYPLKHQFQTFSSHETCKNLFLLLTFDSSCTLFQ